MAVAATTVKKPSENSPIKRANRRRCERKQTSQNRIKAMRGRSWEETLEDASLPCQAASLLRESRHSQPGPRGDRAMNRILRVLFAGAISLILAGENMRANDPDSHRASRSTNTSKAVEPFAIQVEDSVLKDLQDRLMRTRLPDQLAAVRWDYGTDLGYLREVIEYWRTEYDWREQERKLNQLDHFKTTIDGLGIHFIHQRSPEKSALPLVITHGWPGSVAEFMKVLGPLTDPVAHGGRAEDAFHVVLPLMPGYGFSDKPRQKGFNSDRVGQVVAKLMARLGYSRYGAQGGDWGAAVTSWLGSHDAAHVAGIHLNMVWVGPPEGAENPEEGIPAWELERSQEAPRVVETGAGLR